MRYRTSLSGSISIDKPLDDKLKNILNKNNNSDTYSVSNLN